MLGALSAILSFLGVALVAVRGYLAAFATMIIPYAAQKIVVAFGLSLVTMPIVTSVADFIRDKTFEHLNSLPPQTIEFIKLLRLGECFDVIMGAYLFSIYYSRIASGGVKARWGSGNG